MDKLAVHTVLDSVTVILESIGLVPVSVEKFSLEQKQPFFGDIVGSMSLSGVGADGTLILGFETGTALAVVSAMFGEDFNELDETELDEILKSMIGELANMVCGRVKVELSEQGYSIGMATPELYFPRPFPQRCPRRAYIDCCVVSSREHSRSVSTLGRCIEIGKIVLFLFHLLLTTISSKNC